jgi:hypothetical protein
MLGSKDMPILIVNKGEVGVAQINKKFQLHRIVTKFGVPGVLMNMIKSCNTTIPEIRNHNVTCISIERIYREC